ncbi:MAG: endonuclease/exonuclease/phosphatase family protein, partial [Verrucomicrobiae bacterium]|nr:endonuclease/exonuclease/phosphatase family protein [Verrucomicrobiae bacterium]
LRAEAGAPYHGRLGPYARGTGIVFSKVGAGAAWISVEANGDLTGTPGVGDLGTNTFDINVENEAGLSVQASVVVEVTPPGGVPANGISVMTYNLWVGGTVAKNLEGIIKSGADVIGLQETIGSRAREHAEVLGWYYAQSGGSMGILSKYPIVETKAVGSGIGARVQICSDPLQEVVLWSCHLSAFPYGPYDACFDGESVDVLLERETTSGRLPQVERILNEMKDSIAAADTTPVFLVGDFNTPSHLDWTAATAESHCDYSFEWPVTAAVSAAGLKDSYREANPDPAAKPGNTWSPIYSLRDSVGPEEEPQDRIDMIHFAGKDVTVDMSEVFILPGILQDVPNHGGNAWGSDHAAVVSSFTIPVPQGERTGRAFAPDPAMDKTGVSSELTLSWRGDLDAQSYEVYLGNTPPAAGDQRTSLALPSFEVSGLSGGTTYFWSVDTIKAGDVKVQGDVWSFTTASDIGETARWEFDEGTGANVSDSGGGSINGTFVDLDEDAWVNTSILGKGVEFTFDNGWIAFGEEPVLRPVGGVTVASWVRPAFFGDYAGIAGYLFDTGAVESGYTLHTRSNDRFGWGVGTDDRGSILYITSPSSYEPDQWYFVVGTYDGSQIRLYVDGVLVASEALTGPIDYDPLPEAGFIVGTYLDDNDDIRFEGQLTQLEFWPRALSASDVQAQFAGTGAVVCPASFHCVEDPAAGTVALTWLAPANVDATGVELLRDGESIATLPLDATSYSDIPPNANAAGQVNITYTLRLVGNDAATCAPAICTASFFNGSLSDGLVAYISFDDDIADSSGNGIELDVIGVPVSTSDGAVGGAFAFDDTADPRQYVVLEDSEVLRFGDTTDFSVSIWVRTDSPLTDNRENGGTNYDPAIISNKDWNSGLNVGWVIAANSSNSGNGAGNLEWNIGDGSVRADFDTTDAVINDGTWHHILISHDRDDVATFYLDGRQLGTVDISSVGDIDSGFTTNVATDGAEGATWENWFPGELDELAIWNRVVSPDEVTAIYTSGVSGNSAIGGSAGAFQVSIVTYSKDPGGVNLTWPSRASRSYSIEATADFQIWTELEDGISPDAGGTTTFFAPTDSPAIAEQYYRIISKAE